MLAIFAPLDGKTLYARLDWVTEFANPTLPIDGEHQLAIFDEMMRSLKRVK